MIRICYVVDAPFLGGAEMYISRLACALDGRRFSASLLMKAGGGDPQLGAWAARLRADGIAVFEAPMRLPFHPGDAAGVWRHFESHAPHIVHVNVPGPYDGQMGLVLPIARASGARTVVTEHLPMVTPLWKRAAVKRLAYRSLDLAVTMTRSNAKFLCEWQGAPASRVRVVPNGVARSFGADPVTGRSRRWELGLRDHNVVVGYVGNILPHKGLRRLIEAVSRSAHRDVFYLLVVGSGPDEPACRQLALDRGLSDRIKFLGWQSYDEAEQILGACDLLALPSSIEGLPYVVLEAMASRLPVLAGRVYGIPEVVDDGVTGILVDPGSVEEIAAGLDRLAGDSALRAAMGGAGRARFERDFTLERQAGRMEQLYESLLHGGADREASA